MKFEFLIIDSMLVTCIILLRLMFKNYTKHFISNASIKALLLPFFVIVLIYQLVGENFITFNSHYILGIFLGKLPVEVILFIFCGLYVSLFFWYIFSKKFKTIYYLPKRVFIARRIIATVYLVAGIIVGILEYYYTAGAMLILAFTIMLDEWFKTNLLSQRLYFTFVELLLGIILIFNFYRVIRHMIFYQAVIKTTVQVGVVPIEDLLYSVSFVMIATILYKYFYHRK